MENVDGIYKWAGTTALNPENRVKSNTGAPLPVEAENPIAHRYFPGVEGAATNQYTFISTAGQPYNLSPTIVEMDAAIAQCQLKSIEFLNMKPRIQFLVGAGGAGLRSTTFLRETVIDV